MHPLAVPGVPVADVAELLHQLGLEPGLLAHLALRRLRGRLVAVGMALGQRQDLVAHAHDRHVRAPLQLAHHDAARRELADHLRLRSPAARSARPRSPPRSPSRKRISSSRRPRRDRADQRGAGRELLDQRRRRLALRRRRDRDPAERRAVGRAPRPVADAHLDVVVAQLGERRGAGRARRLGSARSSRPAAHSRDSTAAAYPDPVPTSSTVSSPRSSSSCAHAGDDPRLRDRLALADAQRPVAVGAPALVVGHEQLARHLGHRRQHALVLDAAAAQLALHHARARVSGCSSGAVPGHARSPFRGRG